MKKNKSYRYFFALIFGTLIAGVCIIISIFSYQFSSKQVKSQIGSNLAQSSYFISDTLDAQLQSKYAKLNIIKELEVFKSGEDIKQITNVLNLMKLNFVGFSWIGYVSTDGTILASTGSFGVGENMASSPLFQHGIRSRYVSDSEANYSFTQNILPETDGKQDYITFGCPIYSFDNNVSGLLCAYINWDWINEFIRSSVSSLTAYSELDVLVINSENKVQYANNSLLGTELQTESIQKSRFHLNSWMVETYPDNVEYLAGYVLSDGYGDFDGLGWTILTRQPLRTAYKSTLSLLYLTIVIGVICTIIFAWIGWFLAGYLIKPLEEIAVAANQIRLGVPAEIPVYHKIKDLELLSLSLSHLITSLTKTEYALAHMETKALLDPLTSLANRNGFEKYIGTAVIDLNSQKETFTLLFLDLDGFKDVNDVYGHPVGDLVLIEVGNRLKNSIRTNELVARFGGDEFAVVLQTSKYHYKEQIVTVCNRILESLNMPFPFEDETIHIGCSIGCATWPLDSNSIEELQKIADDTLYQSKRNGKNQFTIPQTK